MKVFTSILLMLVLTATHVFAQQAASPARFLQLSRQLQDQQHFAEGKLNAQKAVDGYLLTNEPDSLGEAYVMLWSTSLLSGMAYPDRIPILEKAAAAFEKAGNRRRQADCLKEIADLQQVTGNISAAFFSLQKTLSLYQSVNYPYLQGVYDLLCIVSGYLTEWDESIRYGLLAIRYAENNHDTSYSLCPFYNHLGMAYYALKDFAKADDYFKRSLDFARKYNNADGIVTVAFNMVRVYIYWDKPQKALEFLNTIRARYPDFFTPYPFNIDANLLVIYDRIGPPAKAAFHCAALEKIMATVPSNTTSVRLAMSTSSVIISPSMTMIRQKPCFPNTATWSGKWGCRPISRMISCGISGSTRPAENTSAPSTTTSNINLSSTRPSTRRKAARSPNTAPSTNPKKRTRTSSCSSNNPKYNRPPFNTRNLSAGSPLAASSC